MIKTSSAIFAVIVTTIISSIIPFDNPLGLALKVGLFQMIGGFLGIVFVFFLKDRSKDQKPVAQSSM